MLRANLDGKRKVTQTSNSEQRELRKCIMTRCVVHLSYQQGPVVMPPNGGGDSRRTRIGALSGLSF